MDQNPHLNDTYNGVLEPRWMWLCNLCGTLHWDNQFSFWDVCPCLIIMIHLLGAQLVESSGPDDLYRLWGDETWRGDGDPAHGRLDSTADVSCRSLRSSSQILGLASTQNRGPMPLHRQRRAPQHRHSRLVDYVIGSYGVFFLWGKLREPSVQLPLLKINHEIF